MANEVRPPSASLCSPELNAEQFEQMLAELDAICRQARELSTQITVQMADQKQQERQVIAPLRFPRRPVR